MKYRDEYLRELIFPIGGIGSGSIGLAGNGRLVEFEIFNRPDKGTHFGFSHFAVRATGKNGTVTKVLNSDYVGEYMGRYGQPMWTHNYGFGPQNSTMAGFPHFSKCEFNGEFPIAELVFSDGDFPGEVTLRAFNPFIPLDSKNSSIPAAFFEVEYTNKTDGSLRFDCALSLKYPSFDGEYVSECTTRDGATALFIESKAAKDELDFCDMAITCDPTNDVQLYWYRGEWNDGISTYWHELTNCDSLTDRRYGSGNKSDHCAVMNKRELLPGESVKFRYVISWNVPNCYNYWGREEHRSKNYAWKNYYATVFENSLQSGRYAYANWDSLYAKTKRFKDELYSSTLDASIKDAISSTLSVLKSPVMYRLEDGSLYGFEGVHEKEGSCEGLCQHVYNYAYATCFLFPDLERSVRELEFKYSLRAGGETHFRIGLPLGAEPTQSGHFPCLDGQMGTVIKVYREWKLSGDDAWLLRHFDGVCAILEYAYSESNPYRWDRDRDGVLEGMQHHTLDMELIGPSSWLEGFYLAALKAGAEMAEHLGYADKAREYFEIYEKGREWTRDNLFNGEYFIHKIDITDKSLLEPFDDKFDMISRYWNGEAGQIKYQIGEGCSIDQLTGQWHADLCGLGNIFDEQQIRVALDAMYRYNFKPSMRDVANVWRVFALNGEAGAIMCDYPNGCEKPVIPITYCEECMTGFEYMLAGLLAKHGYADRAVDVVRAIRARYDGKKRNPYNEMECGSHYVRALSSFALLPIYSGFSFDLARERIGFAPIEQADVNRFAWFCGSAWGNIVMDDAKAEICVIDGEIKLSRLSLPHAAHVQEVFIDGERVRFWLDGGDISFDSRYVKQGIKIIFDCRL